MSINLYVLITRSRYTNTLLIINITNIESHLISIYINTHVKRISVFVVPILRRTAPSVSSMDTYAQGCALQAPFAQVLDSPAARANHRRWTSATSTATSGATARHRLLAELHTASSRRHRLYSG